MDTLKRTHEGQRSRRPDGLGWTDRRTPSTMSWVQPTKTGLGRTDGHTQRVPIAFTTKEEDVRGRVGAGQTARTGTGQTDGEHPPDKRRRSSSTRNVGRRRRRREPPRPPSAARTRPPPAPSGSAPTAPSGAAAPSEEEEEEEEEVRKGMDLPQTFLLVPLREVGGQNGVPKRRERI